MVKNLIYEDYSGKAAALMSNYAFMTTCADGIENTMTIGWGTVGIVWNVPIFAALVRKSRFTKGIVDKSGEFTITFPLPGAAESDKIKEALNFCGTKSGQDFQGFNGGKIGAAGLSTTPGKILKTPVLAIGGLNLECSVVFKQDMASDAGKVQMDRKLHENCYGQKCDYHTIYYGQIVAAYEIK